MATLESPLYGLTFSAKDAEDNDVSRTINGLNIAAGATDSQVGSLVQEFVQRMILPTNNLSYGSASFVSRRVVR